MSRIRRWLASEAIERAERQMFQECLDRERPVSQSLEEWEAERATDLPLPPEMTQLELFKETK